MEEKEALAAVSKYQRSIVSTTGREGEAGAERKGAGPESKEERLLSFSTNCLLLILLKGSCVSTMGKSASKQFAEEVLQCHNEFRRKHQAPPLKLSSKLSREASRYAESLASTRILKHSVESSRGSCGENLAWASYDQSGKDVADRWYDEVKQYNFNRPGFSSGTGHFTAMVWKSTQKLGVGKATASDGSSFVVARYFPAGNITNQGHFENNVLPAKTTT